MRHVTRHVKALLHGQVENVSSFILFETSVF